MEINGKLPPVYAKQMVKSDTSSDKVVQESAGLVKTGDRVALSTRARELRAAQKAVGQMPDVDLDKVADIKARIQAGTYRVDASKAAANILAEALLNNPDKPL